MRLTATDKAIGELNMRKADVERVKAYLAKNDNSVTDAMSEMDEDIKDIDRCITLLRSVQPAPKLEKVAKPRAARKTKKSSESDS